MHEETLELSARAMHCSASQHKILCMAAAGAGTTAAASGSDPGIAAVAADVDLVWQEENVSMVGIYIQPLWVMSVLKLLACFAEDYHNTFC